MDTIQPRDEQLWKLAKKRADFKRSLLVYIVINAFLWAIWWFTDGQFSWSWGNFPWPIWVMLGWGIGIVFQYFDAYGGNKEDLREREYRKLKEEQERTQ
jgi:hypothetical protein